jgi:hypothetical protein
MPRIGDTIRPELGKIDYRPMMIAGMKAAESRGGSMGKLIGTVEGAVEKKRTNEGKIGATKKKLKGIADFLGEESEIGRMATQLHEELSNPEYRMSEQLQAAAAAESTLAFASQHIEKMYGRGMKERGMRVAELNQELGGEQFAWQKTETTRLEEKTNVRSQALADAKRDYMQYGGNPAALNALMSALPGGSEPGLLPPNEDLYDTSYRDALSSLMLKKHMLPGPKLGSKVIERTLPTGEEVKTTVPTVDDVPDMTATPYGEVERKSPPGTVQTPAQEAEATMLVKRAEASGERVQFVITSSANSRLALAKMERIEQLLANPEVYTGKFSEWKAGFQEIAHAFGMDTKGLAEFQELGVYLGDFVMQRVQQTKGAVSNAEMKLFAKWSMNPNKTKDANRAILHALKQVETRRLALAQMARDEIRKGTSDLDIEDMMQDYMNNVAPLDFTDPALLGEGGFGDPKDMKKEAADYLRALEQAKLDAAKAEADAAAGITPLPIP